MRLSNKRDGDADRQLLAVRCVHGMEKPAARHLQPLPCDSCTCRLSRRSCRVLMFVSGCSRLVRSSRAPQLVEV